VGRVEREIKTIAQKFFGIKKEQISLESRFKEDLGLDSLDTIEFVLELETEFEISIPDEDALDFKKVADVKEYLEQHVAA
jgi:acyl carrier protein